MEAEPMRAAATAAPPAAGSIAGEFLDAGDERCYVIRNVDHMEPFFGSVISNVDHWLFVSSTGGLTAGRRSPESALFPYVSVDRIHDSYLHTGSRTLLRVALDGGWRLWEPFNREHDGRYALSRNLYKNVIGNKLCFEEVNHELGLAFRYTWATSDEYGFVRTCRLTNTGRRPVRGELLDGLLNILPPGVPRGIQDTSSNLADAYKWNELDPDTGLALYTLYAQISDRAEPRESLRANTVFSLGLEASRILLCARQVDGFRKGRQLEPEMRTRGVRGAYLVNAAMALEPGQAQEWQIVADIEYSQSRVVDRRRALARPAQVAEAIAESIALGSDELSRLMAAADGFQATGEENVAAHHYSNVLFNVLRGGIFDDQYGVNAEDLLGSIRDFNRDVYQRNRALLESLPGRLDCWSLIEAVAAHGDPQLERLCREYLPITFGRRHGDPSRPWNHFEIRPKDAAGNRLLFYQGNWRDIFQNWEALTFSYPEFIESVIAKFVNASTMDGYNPYRITKQGIDWEVEDPEDPWSYIGYWGDHQIIYLEKMLEASLQFHPERLRALLRQPLFCYANVPYRIRPFDELMRDPKSTVFYDYELAERIAERVATLGGDGKLILDATGEVYLVNLAEKLITPLLAKLGNLVVGGGIWLNTQRPEWNDANNALVGGGLSMVTLCYMRRYIRMLQTLMAGESGTIELSRELCLWLAETADGLVGIRQALSENELGPRERHHFLARLGTAASRHREAIYTTDVHGEKTAVAVGDITSMLEDALVAVEHSISANRRDDALYHAYNLMSVEDAGVAVLNLYPMLEGQVAALSSGAVDGEQACALLDALFSSELYREDQQTFMLYPDRDLPSFLDKNRVPAATAEAVPLVGRMLAVDDRRILLKDVEGCYRFNADFRNVQDLQRALVALTPEYGDAVQAARAPLEALYERVFNHRAFTGRSGTMFGFEGLGCIYWHMVAKLLLALQERYFRALDQGESAALCRELGRYYYRVRQGLPFNKSPDEYGAFPTEPYSHTPKHAGAQQPGMTGQVKEEVLTRFGELGLRVDAGRVRFEPALLRSCEFPAAPQRFRYLDVGGSWQAIDLPPAALAFTWCQVPVVYRLADGGHPSLVVHLADGSTETLAQPVLSADLSTALLRRSGAILQITVTLRPDALFRQ